MDLMGCARYEEDAVAQAKESEECNQETDTARAEKGHNSVLSIPRRTRTEIAGVDEINGELICFLSERRVGYDTTRFMRYNSKVWRMSTY